MKKDEAASLLGVKESFLKHFKVQDPYNPQWELEGYINVSEHLYGSMTIFKINDFLTEQIVIGTPKQKYPFDRLGRFRFPEAKRINVYEKYDGTNILAYGYKIKKQVFITYKTRLNPVLGQSRWGNWMEMWDKVKPGLIKGIDELIQSGVNLSFELYGAMNKHLIEYAVPLDAVLLFGIKNDLANPEIIDPEGLPGFEQKARLEVSIEGSHDLYSWYQKLRNEREGLNKFTEEGFIEGGEGFVWYLKDINGKIHQYKCKPPSVEDIHWANSGISKHSILTTIINAYEETDEVTYERVKELLLEEYTENVIDGKKDLIHRLMGEVAGRIAFREKILKLYHELGLNLLGDKVGTMRALSPNFAKQDMRKVFNTLNLEIRPEQ